MRPALPLVTALLLSACVAAQTDASITALPPLPETAFAEGETPMTAQEVRADFAALYEGLKEAHYDLYARRAKGEYDALYEEMMASLDEPLRPSEAAILFQRFAAFGEVAHSRLDEPVDVFRRYRSAGGKALAIYPRVRGDRLFVAESYTDGVRPGDEILAIEGQPAAYWIERLTRNISGDNAYIDGTQLEWAFGRTLFLELGPAETLALRVRRQDGSVEEIDAKTIDQENLTERSSSAQTAYFSLDDAGRKARMLEGGIAYLQPGPFYGVETPENMWDTAAFWSFIDDSFEMFLEQDAAALIIDMRQNPGGDNSFSDRMIAWFADEPFRFASEFLVRSSAQSEASNAARMAMSPGSEEGISGLFAKAYAETPHGETFPFDIPFSRPRDGERFEGPVYAIVDRYSYSNTASVAALLQDYGFATILGEETSDLATSYGAMESFELPNSGLTVGYPKALIIRPSGDRSDRGVVPDITIEAPIFSQTDVMLEEAVSIVRGRMAD